MNDRRSFSHAIAEGDGISVIASVDDPDGARSAESQRAEALLSLIHISEPTRH